MELPLEITPTAWAKIQQIHTQKQIPAHYALRLGMRGSGCSGDFFVGFDVPKPDDALFELSVAKVIIAKTQILYFYTVSLDWIETEKGSGFYFQKSPSNDTNLQ